VMGLADYVEIGGQSLPVANFKKSFERAVRTARR